MARTLNVWAGQDLVGKLIQNDIGKMSFRYDPEWLSNPNRNAISISLPRQPNTFNFRACGGFFSGLLPEEDIRKNIATTLGISPKNDFSMLARIGGDCAGALTFLPEGVIPNTAPYTYKPLTEKELEQILKDLPNRPLLAGLPDMRLSLAGAQTKLSVCIKNETVSLPLNGAPSTHILKPGNPRFPHLVHNEAFCMQLAQKTGLATAPSEVRHVGDISYLLIARYDREYIQHSILKRKHQEDFCQALGIMSDRKYQQEGGPSLRICFELIRQYSAIPAIDLYRFLDAVLYNYLIGNNDAHGKNFSFLYKKTTPLKIQLAPLYDLVSTAYYPELSPHMAMSIGGEYHAEKILRQHFETLATEAGLSKTAVRKHLLAFADKVHEDVTEFHDGNPITAPIKALIQKRCQQISMPPKGPTAT